MPYRFSKNESIADGIQRIAREQIDETLAEVADGQLAAHDTVHQVRKRCKKIRGLLRLVRTELEPVYQQENARFRDAARMLSGVRDAHAAVETYDKLLDYFGDEVSGEALWPFRRNLIDWRRSLSEENKTRLEERLDQFSERIREARQHVESWQLGCEGFEAIEGGLKKTFKRCRKAMATASGDPTTEHYHQWRKCTKYHWYHVRLLRRLWPALLNPQRDAADRLGSYLGDEHDLAVLRDIVRANAPGAEVPAVQLLLAMIDRRRAQLRVAAGPLGRRLFAERPQHLTHRFRCYWDVWRGENN